MVFGGVDCKILLFVGTMDELLLHISQRLEALQVISTTQFIFSCRSDGKIHVIPK